MSVESIATGSTLRIRLETGVDQEGKPIFRNKSINNVKPDATDQELFDMAQVLTGLQRYTVAAVMRVDTAKLNDMV